MYKQKLSLCILWTSSHSSQIYSPCIVQSSRHASAAARQELTRKVNSSPCYMDRCLICPPTLPPTAYCALFLTFQPLATVPEDRRTIERRRTSEDKDNAQSACIVWRKICTKYLRSTFVCARVVNFLLKKIFNIYLVDIILWLPWKTDFGKIVLQNCRFQHDASRVNRINKAGNISQIVNRPISRI